MRTFLILILSVSLLAACGGSTEEAAPEATTTEASNATVHQVRGEIKGVFPDDDPPTLTISHENIEGLMDAMTMPFVVANDVALTEIAEGDKVTFDLTVDETANEPYLITAVEKLDDETELEIRMEEPPAP